MLEYSDWVDEGKDLQAGETKRICHTACPSGEDIRYRLYITRPAGDEGKLVAYCHNCSDSGTYRDKDFALYRNEKHAVYPVTASKIASDLTEPANMVDDIRMWPTRAKGWAMTNGLLGSSCTSFGIKYDPSSNRVFLPRYSKWVHDGSKGDLIGYQLRSIDGNGPKYLTVSSPDHPSYTFIQPNQDTVNNYVVIVEDLLSAINILEATSQEFKGGNLPGVYINHSVRVDPTMCYNIANLYKWVVIWFDNDSPAVVDQARLMKKTIAFYNSNILVETIEDCTDPKHYQHTDILQRLDEVAY